MTTQEVKRKLSKRLLQTSTSWPFLLSLCVLLLNDHWLKIHHPSLLTGKLSDFAGVFLLSLTLFTGFPRRRVESGLVLSMLFAWWKSPGSEPFIQIIRALGFASFGRVVDYTDLFALAMLVVAYLVAGDIDSFQIPDRLPKRIIRALAVITAIFAMLGTSFIWPIEKYSFREVGGESKLKPESAAEAIKAVAKKHGLKCTSVECVGNDIVLEYEMEEPRVVTIYIQGLEGPGCKSVQTKMDALRKDLKAEFGARFKNLEFVEPLQQPTRTLTRPTPESYKRGPYIYIQRGSDYVDKGQYDQAIIYCTRGLEIDPRYAWGYFTRGNAYSQKGQYDKAISDFDKAIEITPGYAAAYNNRGFAYYRKGQYDQAISDYSKALEIDPKSAGTYYRRAYVYYLQKEYDKSWDDIKKTQDLGGEVDPKFLEELRKASGREK